MRTAVSILIALAACSGDPVAERKGTVLDIREGRVEVAGHVLGTADDKAVTPRVGAFLENAPRPVHVDVTGTEPARSVLAVLGGTGEAEASTTLWVDGAPVGPGELAAFVMRPSASKPVDGARRVYSLVLQGDSSGWWVEGRLGFELTRGAMPVPSSGRARTVQMGSGNPLGEGEAVPCEVIYAEDPALAALCTSGMSPRSIRRGQWRVGGEKGCFAELAAGEELSTWSATVPKTLAALALRPEDTVVIITGPETTMAPVAALMRAFGDAGVAPPVLFPRGMALPTKGPTCEGSLTDARAVAEEEAAWLGLLPKVRRMPKLPPNFPVQKKPLPKLEKPSKAP